MLTNTSHSNLRGTSYFKPCPLRLTVTGATTALWHNNSCHFGCRLAVSLCLRPLRTEAAPYSPETTEPSRPGRKPYGRHFLAAHLGAVGTIMFFPVWPPLQIHAPWAIWLRLGMPLPVLSISLSHGSYTSRGGDRLRSCMRCSCSGSLRTARTTRRSETETPHALRSLRGVGGRRNITTPRMPQHRNIATSTTDCFVGAACRNRGLLRQDLARGP